MAELKTKPTKASVAAFMKTVDDHQKRKGSREVMQMMRAVTGKRPRAWGTSIVGCGTYHYKWRSGQEGDWPVTGFSPREQAPAIYVMSGFSKIASCRSPERGGAVVANTREHHHEADEAQARRELETPGRRWPGNPNVYYVLLLVLLVVILGIAL